MRTGATDQGVARCRSVRPAIQCRPLALASPDDANNDIFEKILDDADVRDVLADVYVRKVYARLRDVA